MAGLASAALLLAGCHFPGTGGSGASGNGGTLRVGVVQSVANAPLYIGTRDGLFQQHGVNVQIVPYPTAKAELAALTAGRLDIAAGDYADFLYYQATSPKAKGSQGLRLIADGYDAAPNLMDVLTLPGSVIKTPQSLQDKTIAVPPPNQINPAGASTPYSMEMLATESVLTSDGVSPSTVTWQAMPMSSMVKALARKSVDAILVTEPYIIQAESQLGATQVLDSCSGVTANLPLTGYFTTSAVAGQAAANLRAFRDALLAAQAASAIRGPVNQALPQSAGTSAQEAAMVTVGDYPTLLNVGQVQRVAQLLYEADVTSSLLNVRSMVFS
jgi:NitT/TauT family transport system substrate-binding protein